ncbi:hypothetical protein BLOT_000092 [Blomia tropicalis]|nr:hypothetical protein BLOT_000092 [Blomia tropicalis]
MSFSKLDNFSVNAFQADISQLLYKVEPPNLGDDGSNNCFIGIHCCSANNRQILTSRLSRNRAFRRCLNKPTGFSKQIDPSRK